MPTPPCLSPSGPAVLLIHSTDAAVVRSRVGVGNRLDLSAPLFRELTQYTLFSDITILYGGRWDTVGESWLLKPSRGTRVILSETNCTLRKTGVICGSSGIIIIISHQALSPHVFASSQLTFILKLPVQGVMFVLL